MAPLNAPVRPPRPVVEAVVSALAVPGLGPVGLARALEGAGDPVRAAAGVYRHRRSRLSAAERDRVDGWIARSMATIQECSLHVLMPGYDGYPEPLLQLHEAPPVLFGRGRLPLLSEAPLVGVVGTRRSTAYGRDAAARIAGGLARAGVTIVSGLARGIDAVAHRAAGASRTVAVLGCGVDVLYPRQNAALQESIQREGLLLSERLPGTPPQRHVFPERNRIIAALCQALVVVEAPARSGALITADTAMELGRPVFVVPGPLGSPTFEGANARIRDGAILLTGPGEVLTELGLEAPRGLEREPPPTDLAGVGLALWRVLGPEPRHAGAIAADAGLDAHQGLASLLALEIQGYARQLPGMRFVRARPDVAAATLGAAAGAAGATGAPPGAAPGAAPGAPTGAA